jgi:two-component system phosphate regulon sensor histidine kinase PhoR
MGDPANLSTKRRLAVAELRMVVPAVLRMAVLAAVAVILGAVFGALAGLWFAVLAFGLLLFLHLFYLALLGRWVERPALDTIPDGFGAWAEVFARLYKDRRASERNERRLADNEERFRRTISALPEGIVLIDAALQIEWCNPVAEQHLGINLRGDQGLRLTNLVRDPAFVAFMTSGNFEAPLTFTPLANPTTALSVMLVEFEPARSIVITRDVTQSERVDAMRRDFVANVSHELRTPLTVINGFLEMLLDAETHGNTTRRRHMQLMHEQANRMHRLVEDLLTLSRLESRESPLAEEVFDASGLLRELADEARALSAGRHTVQVEPRTGEPALQLRGSRDELRSAFGNLVSNAVRYTQAGGRIGLCWRVESGGVRFEVEDSGIGIAPEHLPRLTERFYRVDKSRSRETGGTGLGLAIVKHVLLRHDGKLDISSQLGRGSVFSAWLPASRVVKAVGTSDDGERRRAA